MTAMRIATTTLEADVRSMSAPRWSPPGRLISLSVITHGFFLQPGVMGGVFKK
jgi:hypothetical protein